MEWNWNEHTGYLFWVCPDLRWNSDTPRVTTHSGSILTRTKLSKSAELICSAEHKLIKAFSKLNCQKKIKFTWDRWQLNFLNLYLLARVPLWCVRCES